MLLLAMLLPAACLWGAAAAAGEASTAESSAFAGMDTAVAPGNDFFSYANGGWIRTDQIPADRSSDGTFRQLSVLTEQRLAELIGRIPATHPSAVSEAGKISDYYRSFMDEAAIEAKGLSVLRPIFMRIDAIADRAALARYLGSTLRADVDVLNSTNLHTDNLFGLWVAQDLDDPSRYVPFLLQGGLEMPDRDYYLDPSEHMAQMRAQYRRHIATVLRLAGLADARAEQQAAGIFALEERIARVHATRAESEDVKRGDNHWTREQLAGRAPGLDWDAFLGAAGLGREQQLVIWQPAAVSGIAALVGSESLESWRAYLRFHALEHHASFLPRAFVAEQFEFYGHALQGTPQLRDRWKRAVQFTNQALGEAVGKLYVERYFPPSEKAQIEELVRHMLAAFATRIDALTWMAPETRAQAKAKLAALKVGVGYPDHWRDYAALRVVPGDAFGNGERAEVFEYERNLHKLGRPVDRSEWVMEPQLVNAVNLPAMNALNFPAAILQAPFFDPARPAAMNYGGIGATIGHEISHSFDDQGALFDATGRLHDWWTPQDFAHFEASAQQLVAQFDAYRPFPDLSVNGKQTLSENIADLAGLACAYSAFQNALQADAGAASAPLVEGFTPDQQFFLSYALSWRSNIREAALRQQIVTDGHAPARYRADTVRNIDAWYAAFQVQPGQALYLAPPERVRMW
jgi:predicted metalloendopeptidase